MGTNYAVVSKKLTAYQGRILKVPQAIQDQLSNGVSRIATEGKQSMQIAIRSSGTEYSRSQGRAGRNDPSRNSPDMAEAVSARVDYVRAGVGARAAFGWLRGFQNWYQFQEEGFTHPWSGSPVPGMYALRDASELARARLHTLGKTVTTRLAKMIGGGHA